MSSTRFHVPIYVKKERKISIMARRRCEKKEGGILLREEILSY